MPQTPGSSIDRLLAIMRALRDPERGCPWDVEQTFDSIAPYTLEEAYETVDAIQRRDMTDLREELGDLLLQVVFHAQIAADGGHFSFPDVVSAICDKMIRRHPHVFGTARSMQDGNWEAEKKAERSARGRASVLDGIAAALPALVRADKLAKRAAGVGFDWDDKEKIWAKIDEEFGEFREASAGGDPKQMQDEMGDILFVVCNLARHHGVDPDAALRSTNAKFERRFRAIETALAKDGRRVEDASLAEIDAHWDAVKRLEKSQKPAS